MLHIIKNFSVTNDSMQKKNNNNNNNNNNNKTKPNNTKIYSFFFNTSHIGILSTNIKRKGSYNGLSIQVI